MSTSTNTANAQAAGSSDQSESTEYQAPYDQNEDPYQDHYIICFKRGHTLAKHFAFLGKKLEIEGTLNNGYYAELDRELFENVRRDPGVELIEDNTLGDKWGPSEEEMRQALQEEADKERATKAGGGGDLDRLLVSGWPAMYRCRIGFRVVRNCVFLVAGELRPEGTGVGGTCSLPPEIHGATALTMIS